MQATRGDAAIPSLFAAEPVTQATAGQPGLLAELEGQAPCGRGSATHLLARFEGHRRGLVAGAVAGLAILMALLVLVAVLATGGRPGPAAGGAGAGGVVLGAPYAGATSMQPAVVLDDPPPARAGTVYVEPAAGVDGVDPLLFPGEHAVRQPAPVVHRRPAPRVDSDVDLLAALMSHSGRGGAAPPLPRGEPAEDPAGIVATAAAADRGEDRAGIVARALATCPAANTEAGIACRQAACTGHWGEHPSCPRPSAPQFGVE